jgi:hypothetical protein
MLCLGYTHDLYAFYFRNHMEKQQQLKNINIDNCNIYIINGSNKKNNYISIKHFNESGPCLVHSETDLESHDVYEQAVDAAFNTTGFGLQHWDFLERSYDECNKILSEIYRYHEDDGSYYQLRFSRELNVK